MKLKKHLKTAAQAIDELWSDPADAAEQYERFRSSLSASQQAGHVAPGSKTTGTSAIGLHRSRPSLTLAPPDSSSREPAHPRTPAPAVSNSDPVGMLDADTVRNKHFTTVHLREGYDQDEVDIFLDAVENELTRLHRVNTNLHAKLVVVRAQLSRMHESNSP